MSWDTGYNSRIDLRGGTLHLQIGLETAHFIESRRDTTQNTTYYLESGGGDTAQENVFRCSHWGGDTAQNSKKGGGTPHKIQSRLLGGWLAGWLGGPMIIVPILAPSCKLKLARFSAKLRIQDGAECGNRKTSCSLLIIFCSSCQPCML